MKLDEISLLKRREKLIEREISQFGYDKASGNEEAGEWQIERYWLIDSFLSA